jgi:hypothetical protein
MEIDVSKIPSNKGPDRIKKFTQEEIRAGKLTNWDIEKIEMRLPRNNEFPGIISQTNAKKNPTLFSILEKDSEVDKYVLSIAAHFCRCFINLVIVSCNLYLVRSTCKCGSVPILGRGMLPGLQCCIIRKGKNSYLSNPDSTYINNMNFCA